MNRGSLDELVSTGYFVLLLTMVCLFNWFVYFLIRLVVLITTKTFVTYGALL